MANLMWFYDDLTNDVNVDWCQKFTESLPIHAGVIGNITSHEENVEVVRWSVWANLIFGWIRDEVSTWGAAMCAIPRLDCATWAGEVNCGCYKTAAIT